MRVLFYCFLLNLLFVNCVLAQSVDTFQKCYFVQQNDTLRYRLLYPENYNPDAKYPLVLFLHGSGARGNDNEKQLTNVPSVFTNSISRIKYPCFLLVPQCPSGDTWVNFPGFPESLRATGRPTAAARLTLQLVDQLAHTISDMDSNRIYITGYSMGGEGTFDLMARVPQRFTAAIPICAVADTANAGLLRTVNIWMFHGSEDKVNPVKYSRLMYDALRDADGRCIYTEYPGVGHASWQKAYEEPELLPWLFSNVRTHAINIDHKANLSRQDTLRGSVTPERKWWDVLRYDLVVQPFYDAKTISGSNRITYKVVEEGIRRTMQIDLQAPLKIDSVKWDDKMLLAFTRDGDAWFLSLPQQHRGARHAVTIFYSGSPHPAADAPGNGGMTWTIDSLSRPWMATSCQGVGASIWYPCKDHQSDEPDNGASVTLIVPDTLVAISNGRLISKRQNTNQTTIYKWEVTAPINNYGICFYVGKYVRLGESYKGLDGNLSTDFWVLDYNMEKARQHLIPQAMLTLKSYEYWMGAYPFYKDGFKMVEAPYIGMEHQSAIAYGNGYRFGYRGKDISRTGWGLKFDIPVVHEVAHEWFGNSITTDDMADKWVHEGFAAYAEILFLHDRFGNEAANEYAIAKRRNIVNQVPVIPRYGVNETDGSDNYAKGRAIVHMIRQILSNDKKFRQLLLDMNKHFYHTVTKSAAIERYISKETGIDFSKLFDQYLHTTQIPTVEYKISDGLLQYRYGNCIAGFTMPVKVRIKKDLWLTPTTKWQEWKDVAIRATDSLSVDAGFYLQTRNVNKP